MIIPFLIVGCRSLSHLTIVLVIVIMRGIMMIDMMTIILCWPSSPVEDYDNNNNYGDDEGKPGPSDDYTIIR